MMTLKSALLATAFTLLGLGAAQQGEASERSYFKSVAGQWSGPGSIVAGKYKGTRFNCNFDGKNTGSAIGMRIEGTCRVGVFNQPMSIEIKKSGRGFRGKFLDGAKGKGMDIVSGRLRGNKLVVGINRKKLNGAMVAHMRGDDRMQITISVRVAKQMVPVIGLTLSRKAGVIKTSW